MVDDGTLGLLFQDPPDCAGDPPPDQQCFCAVPGWPALASQPRTYELEWEPARVTLSIRDGAGNPLQSLTAPSAECPCPEGFRVPAVPMKVDVNCNLDGQLPGDHVLEVDTITASDCLPGPDRLCLNDGRFEVTTRWSTRAGGSGEGRAVGLTADTGYFWFFDPDNVEVVAKLLDGCTANDRFWFFAAGLTNVGVEITVTDTLTKEQKTYTNPLGEAFVPLQDTGAWPTCPAVTGPWRTPAEVAAQPRDSRTDVLDPVLQVRAGDRVVIEAEGSWNVGFGDIGPDGGGGPGCSGCPVTAPLGSLIGRIGQGAPFPVGSRTSLRAPESGTLFLGSNDNAAGLCDGQSPGSCYDDNRGSLTVTVTLRR